VTQSKMKNLDADFDVAVVGAGVVGTAIARELAKYKLRVALLESESDIGMGTSKANTAIWHTGFDATPGSLEAKLLTRSYHLLDEYVPNAGVPYEKSGAVLIAWNESQLEALPGILSKAHENGVKDARILTLDEVNELEPQINKNALGGLIVPGESIICTFTLPLAYATDAVVNGVHLELNFKVQEINDIDGVYELTASGKSIRSQYVINAAGLYSDEIDSKFGHQRFTVTPRRGELIVFDKLAHPLVKHVLLPIPTAYTKGVLISPTVYGNIMLGPTAEDLEDKNEKGTSAEGTEYLWGKGKDIISSLLDEEVTATYAGLRAATEHKDYQIFSHPEQRYVCVGGIRSTGLSASLGIAEYVLELLRETDLELEPKENFENVKMPYIGEVDKRPFEMEEKIKENPDYGIIVCHCERVTLGEIKDALRSPVPARTLDGLRRRTRSGQGRCQGFHCQADIIQIMADELKTSVDALNDAEVAGE
jgi:glycerol-3-phosphate dehydrogenase